MKRAIVLTAAMVLACSDDTDPFGPDPDDPLCERWTLTSVFGASVPVEVSPGLTVAGGSIELTCSGWYRLTNDMEPLADQVFVGRFEQSGTVIEFHPSQQGGSLVGTVTESALSVEPPAGGASATYTRVP